MIMSFLHVLLQDAGISKLWQRIQMREHGTLNAVMHNEQVAWRHIFRSLSVQDLVLQGQKIAIKNFIFFDEDKRSFGFVILFAT